MLQNNGIPEKSHFGDLKSSRTSAFAILCDPAYWVKLVISLPLVDVRQFFVVEREQHLPLACQSSVVAKLVDFIGYTSNSVPAKALLTG